MQWSLISLVTFEMWIRLLKNRVWQCGQRPFIYKIIDTVHTIPVYTRVIDKYYLPTTSTRPTTTYRTHAKYDTPSYTIRVCVCMRHVHKKFDFWKEFAVLYYLSLRDLRRFPSKLHITITSLCANVSLSRHVNATF